MHCKAYLTIFISLLLSVMMTFMLFLIDGSRINSIKTKTELAMDCSMNALLGEYHKELLKQYELFFIDISYGTPYADISNTSEHLKQYMKSNIECGEMLYTDLYKVQVKECGITQMSNASDESGNVLKRQAVSYMKDLYGLDILDKVVTPKEMENVSFEESNMKKLDELLNEDIFSKWNEVEERLSNMEPPKRQLENGEWETVPINNPADTVNSIRKGNILNLVIEDTTKLSTISFSESSYFSERRNRHIKGKGMNPDRYYHDGIANEILFSKYLLKQNSFYGNELEKAYWKYQIEYILCGDNSDLDNLKKVTNKLILLREAANVITLTKDTLRRAEISNMATGLAAVTLAPEIQPLIEASMLFAWAYVESVQDVKSLYQGNKIPIVKTSKEWRTDLIDILNPGGISKKDISMTDGLDYKDYLRVLLLLENKSVQMERFYNVIEADVRRTPGNENFCIDGCVDSIEAIVIIKSDFGYNCSIKRRYGYS